jgi:hypothetical protein
MKARITARNKEAVRAQQTLKSTGGKSGTGEA